LAENINYNVDNNIEGNKVRVWGVRFSTKVLKAKIRFFDTDTFKTEYLLL